MEMLQRINPRIKASGLEEEMAALVIEDTV